MEILHISDTHGRHLDMRLDLEGVDVLVHTGDATNYRQQWLNEEEFYNFIDWYGSLPIKNKIYVAGNHDSFIYHNKKLAEDALSKAGIIYLNKESVTIDGVKFYGDPTSPTFGDWCFMADRGKIYKHWDLIPLDTNVLLTHSPAKGKLDLSVDVDHILGMRGCSSLNRKLKDLTQLKLHCFGHLHSSRDVENNGVLLQDGIIFSNAAAVIDGKFDLGAVYNKGNLIKI